MLTEIPLNRQNEFMGMLMSMVDTKRAEGIINVDFKFEKLTDMISPKKVMDAIKQNRKELQYTYGEYAKLDEEDPKKKDLADKLNVMFEEASANYNNVMAMLPLAIEDIKTRLLLGDGGDKKDHTPLALGVLSMGEGGELRILESPKVETTALATVDDNVNTGLIEALREDYEALNDAFSGKKYEEAQEGYVTAKERSRYADHVSDTYVEKQLAHITDYLSVFDYIQLGDTLTAQGDYDRAEEKYLQAKRLATGTYFEEGRREAMDALDAMYASREKAEEADTEEARAKAAGETGAAQLASEGDKAFAEGDYEGAKAYYAMAAEKYQQLGDTAHAEMLQTKIDSSGQKSSENKQKVQQAESYVTAGQEQELAGDRLGAKKQYLFAKNIYKELKMETQVTEVNGLIEILEAGIEKEKEEKEESLAAEEESLGAAERESLGAAKEESLEAAERESLGAAKEESLGAAERERSAGKTQNGMGEAPSAAGAADGVIKIGPGAPDIITE